MKKLALFILALFLCHQTVMAEVSVYSEKGKFGLKDNQTNITEAKYKKLVRLGTSSWIMQKGIKFGIIGDDGEIIIEPKYNQAERLVNKYVKFRKGGSYCLLNEKGQDVLGENDSETISYFSTIDLLYGGLIVTSKNHKYGLASFDKKIKINNIFDDIYMPDFNTLVFIYGDKTIEFTKQEKSDYIIPSDYNFVNLEDADLKLSDIANSPFATTGYYSVTLTDYILKIISSISPAYEYTIDELMFSQGADSVSVIMKCSWMPKFPFVYAKNYYNIITDPTNGPLNKAKKNLRKHIKD